MSFFSTSFSFIFCVTFCLDCGFSISLETVRQKRNERFLRLNQRKVDLIDYTSVSTPIEDKSNQFEYTKQNARILQYNSNGDINELWLNDDDLHDILLEELEIGQETCCDDNSKHDDDVETARNLIVLGPDTRIEKLGNPITYNLERYVGLIEIRQPEHKVCTGTLVDQEWIITAGHCIQPKGSTQRNTDLWFYPRRNRNDQSTAYEMTTCYLYSGWSAHFDDNWDIAFCQLGSNPNLGGASFGYNFNPGNDNSITMSGYAKDIGAYDSLYRAYGTIHELSEHRIFSRDIDTYKWASGGPWYQDIEQKTIFATHRGALDFGTPENDAVRLTKLKFDLLCYLIPRC